VIQEGTTSDVPQFSRLIHGAVTERTKSRGQLYGWEANLLPGQGLLIFNVPLSDSTIEQHVQNTVTGKWCRFKDLNVNCMCVHDSRLYGGAQDGTVYQMLESTSDNGTAIQYAALPAFNYLGNPGLQKHICAVQIVSTYQNPADISVEGYADFRTPIQLSPVIPVPRYEPSQWSVYPNGYEPTPPGFVPSPLGSFWDTEYWSAEGQPFTTLGWQNVSAFGFAVTVAVRFAEASNPVTWRSTNIRFYTAGAQ